MKIGVKKEVEVEAKTLAIHIKVVDEFSARLLDQNGEVIKDYEGYVPGFMPGEHFGDYLILDIDIESGRIANWRVPRPEEIAEFVNGGDE